MPQTVVNKKRGRCGVRRILKWSIITLVVFLILSMIMDCTMEEVSLSDETKAAMAQSGGYYVPSLSEIDI